MKELRQFQNIASLFRGGMMMIMRRVAFKKWEGIFTVVIISKNDYNVNENGKFNSNFAARHYGETV